MFAVNAHWLSKTFLMVFTLLGSTSAPQTKVLGTQFRRGVRVRQSVQMSRSFETQPLEASTDNFRVVSLD